MKCGWPVGVGVGGWLLELRDYKKKKETEQDSQKVSEDAKSDIPPEMMTGP
jgi:hypothetical protein